MGNTLFELMREATHEIEEDIQIYRHYCPSAKTEMLFSRIGFLLLLLVINVDGKCKKSGECGLFGKCCSGFKCERRGMAEICFPAKDALTPKEDDVSNIVSQIDAIAEELRNDYY